MNTVKDIAKNLEAERLRRENIVLRALLELGGRDLPAGADGVSPDFRIVADHIPQLAWMADESG